MIDGVLPTPEAWRTLQREVGQLRLDLGNLRRNLAHVSTRRHEAVWIPPPIYNGSFTTGSFSADTSETQEDFTSLSEVNDSGRMSLATGIVTCVSSAVYDLHIALSGYTQIIQNDYCRLTIKLQHRDDTGSPWSTVQNSLIYDDTRWPNSTVLSGALGDTKYFTHHVPVIGFPAIAGSQFRLISQTAIRSSAPTIDATAWVYYREARRVLTASEG